MTGRERFQRAMTRRHTDRVPIDLGATTLTGMSAGFQSRLRQALGFTGPLQPANSGIDERILAWAGTDFRAVGGIVDLPSVHTRQLSATVHVDCWGIRSELLGSYWEATGRPLAGASMADLREFPWPEARVDEMLLARWKAEARRLQADGRYAVVGEHPVFGVLELGCWMCGYDEFLTRLAGDEDFVRAFFDKCFEIQSAVIEQYYGVLGKYLDVTTSGDDFGMQTGPIVSPAMFERLIAPYFAERIRRTKVLAPRCRYWHHTCGSVADLLGAIIACGVDILNPIQTSAAGMDPAALKARFGDRLAFWGAMDVQDFLPNATPDEVRQHTRYLIDTLGRDGGYVIAPAHNIQDDVPVENVIAWIEEASRS